MAGPLVWEGLARSDRNSHSGHQGTNGASRKQLSLPWRQGPARRGIQGRAFWIKSARCSIQGPGQAKAFERYLALVRWEAQWDLKRAAHDVVAALQEVAHQIIETPDPPTADRTAPDVVGVAQHPLAHHLVERRHISWLDMHEQIDMQEAARRTLPNVGEERVAVALLQPLAEQLGQPYEARVRRNIRRRTVPGDHDIAVERTPLSAGIGDALCPTACLIEGDGLRPLGSHIGL